MKRFSIIGALACTFYFASTICAADGEPYEGFFNELFSEIEEAEAKENPVSLVLVDKAITAVRATHAYFRGRYQPLPRSIFRAFKEGSVPELIKTTATAINQGEGVPAETASMMGISPRDRWAGGGEENWERSIPEAARVPAFWKAELGSLSSYIDRPEHKMIEWPKVFEVKGSFVPSPTSFIHYYFLPKKIKSIGISSMIFLNGGTQTCVILAAGDIRVYDRNGTLRDCVIISTGNVSVGSSEFLTIIAKGSVKFEDRNTSSVALAGAEISGRLVDEGALSFGKAHFLAKKITIKKDTGSSSGAYKDYFVKLVENDAPFSAVEKLIEKREPNLDHLEQLSQGQTKYWNLMENLNSSNEPVLLLAQGLSSGDAQIRDISLHLMGKLQVNIPDVAVPSVAKGLVTALNDKDPQVQLDAVDVIEGIGRNQGSSFRSSSELQRTLSDVAQSKDRHLSWRSLMAFEALGLSAEAVPGLALVARNSPDPFLRSFAVSILGRAAVKQTAFPEEIFLEALNDTDADVVSRAISSLGELQHKASKSIPALTRIAEGKNVKLAAEARWALTRLGGNH